MFKGRVTRLVNQFSAFEALPGLHVNGATTIGENIGDLGGLNMAYHAYQLSLKGKPAPVSTASRAISASSSPGRRCGARRCVTGSSVSW